MTVHSATQIAGPAFTLAGVGFGIWGTYLLVRSYHAGSSLTLWKRGVKILMDELSGRRKHAAEQVTVVAHLAQVNREDRGVTLLGYLLIFFGFILQGIGTVCWGIDAVAGIQSASKPSPALHQR